MKKPVLVQYTDNRSVSVSATNFPMLITSCQWTLLHLRFQSVNLKSEGTLTFEVTSEVPDLLKQTNGR